MRLASQGIREALRCNHSGCFCKGARANVHCPAHHDPDPSLSVTQAPDGNILWYCHAGCSQEEVLTALKEVGLLRGEGASNTPVSNATVQQEGLTLEEYASAKQLPVEFLKGLGLTTFTYMNSLAVRIPYLNSGGEVASVQFRIALTGDKHRWKRNDNPTLYGLDRLSKTDDFTVLVEGPSDTQTLWYNGIPAIGLPSANGWKDQVYADYFSHLTAVYIVVEPDQGGETVLAWLRASKIRNKVHLLHMPDGFNDPSDLWCDDPARFRERWDRCIANAQPWPEIEEANAQKLRKESWELCKDLALDPNILQRFTESLPRHGLVGEDRIAKLVYLSLVSRFLDRQVSLAIKGTSSSGKSFIVQVVLKFFPDDQYHAFTAMSDRFLVYSDADYKHKILVLYEWEGMRSDIASYIIRTLLSEGHLKYGTTDKGDNNSRTGRVIEIEGPTGLIVTTTAAKINAENETRMLSATVNDTAMQTKNIMRALARGYSEISRPDNTAWLALQDWLALATHDVVVPFAKALAELMPDNAVRLRRDFGLNLRMIESCALLHQASRERSAKGQVVATLDDYDEIRGIANDLLSEGVGKSVSKATRDTVEAVQTILASKPAEVDQYAYVTTGEIKELLNLRDRSTANRRVNVAIQDGYLRHIPHRGKEYRLTIGDPMPVNQEILPSRQALEAEWMGDDAMLQSFEGV